MTNTFADVFGKQDDRPPKNGWHNGFYIARCNNCDCKFIGAKGSYNCADCAYDFDEELKYEKMWRESVWQITLNYIYRKSSLFKEGELKNGG